MIEGIDKKRKKGHQGKKHFAERKRENRQRCDDCIYKCVYKYRLIYAIPGKRLNKEPLAGSVIILASAAFTCSRKFFHRQIPSRQRIITSEYKEKYEASWIRERKKLIHRDDHLHASCIIHSCAPVYKQLLIFKKTIVYLSSISANII